MNGVPLQALYFDIEVYPPLRGIVTSKQPCGCSSVRFEQPSYVANFTSYSPVEITTGKVNELRCFPVGSKLTLSTGASGSAFDPSTGNLALLFIEPTDRSDWSGGDPKTAWVMEVPTRDTSSSLLLVPPQVDLLASAKECTSQEAETRVSI